MCILLTIPLFCVESYVYHVSLLQHVIGQTGVMELLIVTCVLMNVTVPSMISALAISAQKKYPAMTAVSYLQCMNTSSTTVMH